MISVAVFDRPQWNIAEIKRYARIMGEDSAAESLIEDCIVEAEPALSYKVCYTTESVIREENILRIGSIRTLSQTLKKALFDCEQAVIFAATVGTPYDRLIAKYSRLSPAKALILQAIGAERAEALCDAFVSRYAAEHDCRLKTRVSPGYGDIPLALQRDIFAMLDCPRKIGLTLNESLLMSPSKSVTAFAGITCGNHEQNEGKCSSCDNLDCEYRIQRYL